MGKLTPEVIAAVEIVADYHTHTRYSHGTGTVADNARAAAARGLAAVGIADHGPASYPWLRASPADLRAMRREVDDLNRQGPVQVLAGVEANVVGVDGALDVPREILDELDVVLAGLHPTVIPPTLRDGWHLLAGNWLARLSGAAAARARTRNTKALVEAVQRYDIDILTHPGWGLPIDTGELARACARRETAMEINAAHGNMTVEYCRLVARAGCYFSIGSDAHRPEDVGNLERALQVARAAGLRPEQVLNARGGPGLIKRRVDAAAQPDRGEENPAQGRKDWDGVKRGEADDPPGDCHRHVRGRQDAGAEVPGGPGLFLCGQPTSVLHPENGGTLRPVGRQDQQARPRH